MLPIVPQTRNYNEVPVQSFFFISAQILFCFAKKPTRPKSFRVI